MMKLHEMKFGVTTDEHDMMHKVRKIEEFIREGDKVKASVFFKGREMEYKALGARVLEKVRTQLMGIVEVEQNPTMEGRLLFMVLVPSKSLTSKKK